MRFAIVLRVDSDDIPPSDPLEFMEWFDREDFFLFDVSSMPERDMVNNPIFTSPINTEEELPNHHPSS